jgi:hypothetical protein
MIIRYCDVCLAFYKKRVKATFVAGANDINNETVTWYECKQHGPMQNHLNVMRIGRLPFSEWFRLHGFRYNPSSGTAEFEPSDHPGREIRIKPCPVKRITLHHPLVEALLKKPDGMVKR